MITAVIVTRTTEEHVRTHTTSNYCTYIYGPIVCFVIADHFDGRRDRDRDDRGTLYFFVFISIDISR